MKKLQAIFCLTSCLLFATTMSHAADSTETKPAVTSTDTKEGATPPKTATPDTSKKDPDCNS